MNHHLSGFLHIDAPAALQGAALATHRLQQLLVGLAGNIGELESGLQKGGIVLAQVVQQFQRHLLFIKSVLANGATAGQVVAGLGHDDAGP